MAVTTKGILSPRSADLKILDNTNICSYNGLVKMGVGGVSAKTSVRLEDVAAAMDEYLRRADEDLGERLPDLEDQLHDLEERLRRMSRVGRARRQLELRMWRTSPLFCKAL
jgi:TolA-binding protein